MKTLGWTLALLLLAGSTARAQCANGQCSIGTSFSSGFSSGYSSAFSGVTGGVTSYGSGPFLTGGSLAPLPTTIYSTPQLATSFGGAVLQAAPAPITYNTSVSYGFPVATFAAPASVSVYRPGLRAWLGGARRTVFIGY